ncbi:Uncharacterised protein [Xylophilus ampelinus]|nr:Uncharacterised protein [Xylophilus ampelinus]
MAASGAGTQRGRLGEVPVHAKALEAFGGGVEVALRFAAVVAAQRQPCAQQVVGRRLVRRLS